MSDPPVSVVIPTYNGGPRFRECLEAVAAQEVAGGFELLCIDSGSTDGTAEAAEGHGRVIRIAKSEFNHGLTRNRAIAETKSPFIALLVQDAVPHGRRWLTTLVEAVKPAGVAGAYCRQTPRPDCPPFIRARLERWSASASEREVKNLSGRDEMAALPILERIRRMSFDNVSSCLKREAWERHPFPERRFGEDSAWAREVLFDGWSLVYEPAAVVEHSHANGLWYEFKRVYLDHRNWREVAQGCLFNNPVEVAQASWNGIFERWAEVSEQGLTGGAGLYWRAYAVPWSLSQNLAQYWGSRSMKAAQRWSWYRKVDDFMSRGV